jgi:hypothetical protein
MKGSSLGSRWWFVTIGTRLCMAGETFSNARDVRPARVVSRASSAGPDGAEKVDAARPESLYEILWGVRNCLQRPVFPLDRSRHEELPETK